MVAPATVWDRRLMKVFDDVPRYDKTRRAESEPEFAFLNRTGSVFFEPVRGLFEMWVAALPLEHRTSVIGQLPIW